MEYGLLRYYKFMNGYSFRLKNEVRKIEVERQDDVLILNNLATVGWRLMYEKEDGSYMLERELRK